MEDDASQHVILCLTMTYYDDTNQKIHGWRLFCASMNPSNVVSLNSKRLQRRAAEIVDSIGQNFDFALGTVTIFETP
jgi:hypothetical protein